LSYGPDSISITIYIAPVPGEGASLTTVLLLVNKVTNPLDGSSRYLEFNSATDVSDALTATYISSVTAQGLTDAFSQSPKPKKIIVGYVDTAGAESYADGLDAVIAAGANFYVVTIDSRADADILAVSARLEALGFRFLVLQSDDADWLTSGYPVAMAAIEGRERTVITYHDAYAEWLDLCAATARSSFDPDVKSAPWNGQIKEVADYTIALTSSQKTLALANEVNTMTTWGTQKWFSEGKNANDRPIDHIVTVDWFQTRLSERITDYVQLQASKGNKIVVGTVGQTGSEGQVAILGVIQGLIQDGIDAGHFIETEDDDGNAIPNATAQAVTAADITGQKLRFACQLVFTTGAINFDFDLYFSAI